jgi:hypothetical protein
MRTLLNLFQTFKINGNSKIPDKFKTLGRWQITYNRPEMNKKIDLANEDHCGVCYSNKYHNIKYIESINISKKNPIIDLE